MITGRYPNLRLRRNRKTDWARRLVEESSLSCNDLILPIFLIEGINTIQPIKTMPGVFRYSIDKLSKIIDKAISLRIPMVALFPYTHSKVKNKTGSEALNENNLVCRAIRLIKKKAIIPSEEEISVNLSSRSAKLRYVIKKTDFYDFETDIHDRFKNLIDIENFGKRL